MTLVERLRINGVALGASKEQVEAILGPPHKSEIEGDIEGWDYRSGAGYGYYLRPYLHGERDESIRLFSISFSHDKVVSVSGGTLTFDGRELAQAGTPHRSCDEEFGEPRRWVSGSLFKGEDWQLPGANVQIIFSEDVIYVQMEDPVWRAERDRYYRELSDEPE